MRSPPSGRSSATRAPFTRWTFPESGLNWPPLYGQQGDVWDEAIRARESAIAAGYRSVPHRRAEIAEVLLETGRRPEADPIYAGLREECEDDVWLYNSAGWAYARAGDHSEALRWLDEGIEVAMMSGDPDDLLDQLMDNRWSSARGAWRDERRRDGRTC